MTETIVLINNAHVTKQHNMKIKNMYLLAIKNLLTFMYNTTMRVLNFERTKCVRKTNFQKKFKPTLLLLT